MGWGPPVVVIYLIMVGIALIAFLHVNGCIIFWRSLSQDSIGKGFLWMPLHARIGWGLLLIAMLLDSCSIYRLSTHHAAIETPAGEIDSGTHTEILSGTLSLSLAIAD